MIYLKIIEKEEHWFDRELSYIIEKGNNYEIGIDPYSPNMTMDFAHEMGHIKAGHMLDAHDIKYELCNTNLSKELQEVVDECEAWTYAESKNIEGFDRNYMWQTISTFIS